MFDLYTIDRIVYELQEMMLFSDLILRFFSLSPIVGIVLSLQDNHLSS